MENKAYLAPAISDNQDQIDVILLARSKNFAIKKVIERFPNTPKNYVRLRISNTGNEEQLKVLGEHTPGMIFWRKMTHRFERYKKG